MGKSELPLEHEDALSQGLLDIGRASRASGVTVKMIRHYEAIGLLKEVARTYANYRVYSDRDVHMLRFIKRARTLGFSVENIRELLSPCKSRPSASVKKVAAGHIGRPETENCCDAVHADDAGAPDPQLPWRPAARLSDPGGSGGRGVLTFPW